MTQDIGTYRSFNMYILQPVEATKHAVFIHREDILDIPFM